MSKKVKIQIKYYFTGSVLFEYECEDNTISKTVQEAVSKRANLRSAYLSGANLSGANLRSADLRSAYLSGANLSGAKNADLAIAMTRILPEGQLIGYKKCQNGIIVKLQIPAKAKRSHAFGRKCRAEYAKVLRIYGATEAVSTYDKSFIYRKGEIVRPDKWDDDWTDECSSGVHFFITREEAEAYV